MNGLYPGPATAPGANLASGNPSGPGVAIRVGLKSGAPAKLHDRRAERVLLPASG